MRTISLIFSCLILFSCVLDQEKKNDQMFLFERLDPTETGVNFQNRLRESVSQNVLTYEYYYNGSGLAIADFNGDDLPDIFMVSNLEDNKLFLNSGNLKFSDVTNETGLNVTRGFNTGVSTVDINSDGLIDIYLCRSGRFTDPKRRENLLFVNQGNSEDGIPKFKEAAAEYGLNISSYSTQAAFLDYDRDGDLDMFLISHNIDTYEDDQIADLAEQFDPNIGETLYENNDGTYRDVTQSAGIVQNKLGYGLGVGVSDLNNDGWPDIYVSTDYSGKDHLYLNNQNGNFSESINESTEHISFYSMGNDLADINNDGLMDVVVLDMVADNNYDIKTSMGSMDPEQFYNLVDIGQHKQYMFNSMLFNNGTIGKGGVPKFSDVAQMSGVANTDWSWAPLLFDFDNDGNKDLFVTNGIKRNIRNNDAMKAVKTLNAQLLQASNQQEISSIFQQALKMFPYHRKPNFFFQNKGDFLFENVASKVDSMRLPTASNGAAYADLDLDGDLELVVNNVDQNALIYRNLASEKGKSNFIQISANGPAKNPLGIGLKATILYGDQQQIAELYTVRGYLSSVEPIIHFGLGEVAKVDEIKIEWPDGKMEFLSDPAVNKKIVVKYADAALPNNQVDSKDVIFKDVSDLIADNKPHLENEFDDFERESLLPHRMSRPGPALDVADINGDGLDDFYVGGAIGTAGHLFLQQSDGSFEDKENSDFYNDIAFEDAVALFLDFDNDGDKDLIVGSGGNEYPAQSDYYKIRLYENDGSGNLTSNSKVFPDVGSSISVIAAADFDQDQDLDLFIGGRQVPGKYPYPANSYLLENLNAQGQKGFSDVTLERAGFLSEYGMVTDAQWTDCNGDGKVDLITVGEWMSPRILINSNSVFKDETPDVLLDQVGWWFSVTATDLDNDGDQDFIAGNLGLNYKYKASKQEPFEIYTHDFDENGSEDIVLSYKDNGKLVPLRGRECSSGQMPFIATKFPTYNDFGNASLTDVFSENLLNNALHHQATNFAHSIFLNDGNNQYSIRKLARASQMSSVNDLLLSDFNDDGMQDLMIAGNLLGAEVETPASDASYGLLLIGDGKGNFNPSPNQQSGLAIEGETRFLKSIKVAEKSGKHVLVSRNSEELMLLNY